jgi:replicative DNA helicase
MRHPEKVALAIFDYLQLADAPEAGRHQTRAQQVSNDCRRLKRIAKSLGITIIAPSSLKRDSKKIAEKPPVMDDLKESGDVEYAADTILLLWNRDRKDGPVDLIVEKNKKGRPPRCR